MPRLYHVDIAAHAAQADNKWVDNLLSHFSIPGVEGGLQGSARRISPEGIHHVALVRILTRDFDIPVRAAVVTAARLLSNEKPADPVDALVSLILNRDFFLREIGSLIAEGVESLTPLRRGRPPAGRARS